MSLVTRIGGDVTKITRGVICHGVNCQGIMGAGVALAIRRKWPSCFNDYQQFINDSGGPGPHLLGLVAYSRINSELFIAHCFTQNECTPGKVNATAASVGNSLNSVLNTMSVRSLPVFMPEIGGLRGGLDFERDVLPQVAWATENNGYPITVLSFKE